MACYKEHRIQNPSKTVLICPVCEEKFEVKPCIAKQGRTFCSVACSNIGKTTSHPVLICPVCSEPFSVFPSQAKEGGRKYCSVKCMGIGVGQQRIGPNHHRWKGGKENKARTLYKHICKECKREFESPRDNQYFCNKQCYGVWASKNRTGEKAGGWKGGTTAEYNRLRRTKPYKDWRESVFARDNWTCQKCATRGGRLHPHHVKSWSQFPELRFEVENGTTLCVNCHYHTHSEQGDKTFGYA